MRHVPYWKIVAAMMAMPAGMISAVPCGWASTLVAELQSKEMFKTIFTRRAGDVRAALREAGIGYKAIKPGPDGVTSEISDAASIDKAREIIERLAKSGDPVLTFEQKGQQFTLKLPEPTMTALIDQAAGQSLTVLQRRLADLKLKGSSVERQDRDRFLIKLPESADALEVGKVIGQTGMLTFQATCDEQPGGQASTPSEDCAAYALKNIPDEKMWVKTAGAAIVDGSDINDASADISTYTNEPVVNFRFNQKGTERFGQLTRDNVGRAMAIILDELVISAPRVMEPILGGSGQISGQFTTADAHNLALVLRSGALPAPISLISMGP